MKRCLYLLFLVFISYKTYGQEQFFGDHNGVSPFYLRGVNVEAKAAGLGIYLKKGLIFGFGYEKVHNIESGLFNLLFCPNWKADSVPLKVGFGPTYSYVQKHHVVGFSASLIGCFFLKSNFPFSIDASCSPQYVLSGYKEIIPIVGLGYTQAIFAQSTIHPVFGLSFAHDLNSKTNLYTAAVGINIKID